jgi:predicted PurR-regulated permease PerM
LPDIDDDRKRLILWTLAMVVTTIAVCWAAYVARHTLLLIYISILFSIGFAPLVRWIETQKILPVGTRFPRWLAILVLYVAIIGTLVIVGIMVIPPLVQQARGLWEALPSMFDQAQNYLIGKGLLQRRLTLQDAVAAAPGTGGDAVSTVLQAVTGIVGGLVGVFTILILTFYILVESDSWFDAFLRLFPRARRPDVADACRQVTTKVSAWLTGQLVLAGVIGTTAAIGLWLLGVPYFYVLALIAAIGEMIPVVGPVLSAIPAIAVAFTDSGRLAFFVLIFFVCQQQFENHVLVPKVMERQVGVSAVTVIVALLIGGSLLGVVGAILAVPSAAIIQVVLQEVLADEPTARGRRKQA